MKHPYLPLRLSKSPLVYVLCQVRFSAVVAIEKYIPSIQEQLRNRDLPRFQKGVIQEFRFGFGANAPTPQTVVSERYEFQDKERSWGVVLAQEFITVHTSKYTVFETFHDRLLTVVKVLSATAAPALVERIGLRYVDLIRPENGALSQYLKPELLGFNGESIGVVDSFNRSEYRGSTPFGTLFVKVTERADGQLLPPDLVPSNLDHKTTVEPGEKFCHLDLDHSSDQSVDFVPEAIVSKAADLHDVLEAAFRESVTPQALDWWGNETIGIH